LSTGIIGGLVGIILLGIAVYMGYLTAHGVSLHVKRL